MHAFKDPSARTRLAIISVWAYLAAELIAAGSSLYLFRTEPFVDPAQLILIGGVQILAGVAMIASIVVVAFWIYRVSANAHALSDEMTISPGWAVGWYFVPIANLFKPFQGMKEAWMASHFRGNWHGEPTPALLGWWWGLWIVTNILANVSFRISMEYPDVLAPGPVVALDITVALLSVPLCILLVRLMRAMCHAQLHARHDETFA